MKKILFVLFCLTSFSFLFAEGNEPLRIEKNVAISEGRFIYLSDSSMWVVVPVAKKKRNILQWIRRVQIPQPENNFLFNLRDWTPGTELMIEEHVWSDESLAEIDKYHQPLISTCSHFLVNYHNQQMAFARKVVSLTQAIEIFSEFAQNMYEEGESKGYDNGHKDGYKSGYNTGYKIGYSIGYSEGYDRAYYR